MMGKTITIPCRCNENGTVSAYVSWSREGYEIEDVEYKCEFNCIKSREDAKNYILNHVIEENNPRNRR